MAVTSQQEWVKTEGVLWVFHTLYTTSTSQWDSRKDIWSPKMFFETSGSKVAWSTVGHCDQSQWPMESKWMTMTYSITTPRHLPGNKRTDDPWNPIHFPGQPVGLPAIGKVLLVLKTPLNMHAGITIDAHGREHKVNPRWTIPSF